MKKNIAILLLSMCLALSVFVLISIRSNSQKWKAALRQRDTMIVDLRKQLAEQPERSEIQDQLAACEEAKAALIQEKTTLLLAQDTPPTVPTSCHAAR